jgi:hypothetical protein
MLDLRVFQSARFSAASGAITLVFFSMLRMMFIFHPVLATGAG